jgi:predicted nucleic acid-binding protein
VSEPVTVDASVFVNAFSPTESGSDKSVAYLNRLTDKGTPVIVPILLLPEIAASIARKQGDTELAYQLVEHLRSLANLTFVPLEENLAELSVETAVKYKLRGSDAVYAAVALRFGTQLVTLDREQLERLEGVLPVGAP